VQQQAPPKSLETKASLRYTLKSALPEAQDHAHLDRGPKQPLEHLHASVSVSNALRKLLQFLMTARVDRAAEEVDVFSLYLFLFVDRKIEIMPSCSY
jgi:hypothetical protein